MIRGEQGETGERGPKGDHGQQGEKGPRGAVRYDEGRELARDRKAFYRAASLLALPVALVALIPSLLGLWLLKREIDSKVVERQRTTFAICENGRKNREAIRGAILGSDPTKLQPGDYGYSYARAHPAEAKARSDALKTAVEDSKRGRGPLARFPEITCLPPGGKPQNNQGGS